MALKKLTLKQKLGVLIKSRTLLKYWHDKDEYYSGLCGVIDEILRSKYGYNFKRYATYRYIFILIPELKAYRPRGAGPYWFNLTDEGYEKRINILNSEIKNLRKKVKRYGRKA